MNSDKIGVLLGYYYKIVPQFMNIKHTISFKLRSFGKTHDRFQIRLRVTFNGSRYDVVTGCVLCDRNAWDDENELVKDSYVGQKGETARSMNERIRSMRDQMKEAIKYFEANEIIPDVDMLQDKFKEKMGRLEPAKHPRQPHKRTGTTTSVGMLKVFDEFLADCGTKNAWSEGTYGKMRSLKVDLREFRKNLKFSDLNEKTLTAFVVYLRDEKKLNTPRKPKGEREKYDQEDVTGLKNTTIFKKLGYLRWFLNWATEKGYNEQLAFRTFHPTLKTTQAKVIYLTEEELKRILALDLSSVKKLEPIRDIFIFCCFSGLRFSDAQALCWSDVKADHLEVTTIKTADSVQIEINDVTRKLLDKYKGIPMKANRVLPQYTNQAMNRELKTLCKMAGIDEPIRITTYKGSTREDKVFPKWELVGSHTGRKTFIVQALSRGIPPNIVMKWTGHSDYKAMKPYIDIVDSIKASEMAKMNFLDD